MSGVVVKGKDIDSFVEMPAIDLNISNQDANCIGIDIDTGQKATKRIVNIRNTGTGKRGLYFRFNLMLRDRAIGAVDQSEAEDAFQYPQKHEVSVVITGANGPNGLLLTLPAAGGGTDYTNVSNILIPSTNGDFYNTTLGDETFPSNFAQACLIREWDSSTLNGSGDEIIASNGWAINESGNWVYGAYDTTNALNSVGIGNTPYGGSSNAYTRSTNLISSLAMLDDMGYSQYASKYMGYNHYFVFLRYFKWLNMLYSDGNRVVLRFTFEMDKNAGKLLKIEKFTSGVSELS